MNTEDSEFQRIEREALRRAQAAEDDDTQVYAKPWVGLTDEEKQLAYYKVDSWRECIEFIETKLKEKNT